MFVCVGIPPFPSLFHLFSSRFNGGFLIGFLCFHALILQWFLPALYIMRGAGLLARFIFHPTYGVDCMAGKHMACLSYEFCLAFQDARQYLLFFRIHPFPYGHKEA